MNFVCTWTKNYNIFTQDFQILKKPPAAHFHPLFQHLNSNFNLIEAIFFKYYTVVLSPFLQRDLISIKSVIKFLENFLVFSLVISFYRKQNIILWIISGLKLAGNAWLFCGLICALYLKISTALPDSKFVITAKTDF